MPQAQTNPQSILSPLNIPQQTKADLWEIAHSSRNEAELATRLQHPQYANIPNAVKADLWEWKKSATNVDYGDFAKNLAARSAPQVPIPAELQGPPSALRNASEQVHGAIVEGAKDVGRLALSLTKLAGNAMSGPMGQMEVGNQIVTPLVETAMTSKNPVRDTTGQALGIDTAGVERASRDRNYPMLAEKTIMPLLTVLLGGELARSASSPVPSEATATSKLYAASDVTPKQVITPQLLNDLKTAAPVIQKAQPGAVESVNGARDFFSAASREIENYITVRKAQAANASVDFSPIAQAVRQEAGNAAFQKLNAGAAARDLNQFASEIDGVKSIGEAESFRRALSDELSSVEKKQGLSRYELMGDPAQGPRYRALDSMRDAISDSIAQATGDPSIRPLRSQQAALMRLEDVFRKRAVSQEAQTMLNDAQPTSVRFGRAVGNLTQYVVSPKHAAMEALKSPATADSLTQGAFPRRPTGTVGSLVAAILARRNGNGR